MSINIEDTTANSSAVTEESVVLAVETMSITNADKGTIVVDEADLEYDEEFASLEVNSNVLDDNKFGNGQFTSDNLIDEDFEAELGAQVNFQENLLDSEIENKKTKLKERIDRYSIVNVCGTDKMGRPIIVVSASKLPDVDEILKEKEFFKNHQHFFETLLEVLSTTLEQYVEAEYTLVYLHHGLRSTSQPSYNWLVKLYNMLDRKFKKNLKALYIVHPTSFIKFLWHFLKPFISSKVNKKVTYCSNLSELAFHIELDLLQIPDMVKQHDSQLKIKNSKSHGQISENDKIGRFQQFKVSLESIAENNKGDCIPLCLKETVIFLKQNLDEDGIFRKSGNATRIKEIKKLYNHGQPVAYDQNEVHTAACVLKAFFGDLPESLLPESLFDEIVTLEALDVTDKVDVAKDLLKKKLPVLNYNILKFLMEFLSEVASHSKQNKMSAMNLSIVFSPNFLRQNEYTSSSLLLLERINKFVELLIKYQSDIFN